MKLPQHVAVIMDGNGRWAAQRGLPRTSGHQSGIDPVRMIIEQSARRGIVALTLFAFSSENWRRPQEEIESLMNLFLDALTSELEQLQQRGVRLRFIGDRAALPGRVSQRMQEAAATTAANTGLQLQIALSYGGRSDIVNAARRLAADCARGALRSEEIDEACFSAAVALAGLPEPDLFIRTGGEQRLSNFLLWNLAYTELYFTDTLWPDFDLAAFELALQHYGSRQRRFGLTGEQVGAE